MKKKRPSLLLEVLLAMSLLAICMSELILRPIHFHRAAIQQLEQIDCDRIAAWTFSEIKETLLKSEIPWNQIPALKVESKSFELSKVPLQIPQLSFHNVPRTFTLRTLKEKIDPDGKIYRLVSVKIKIGKKKFTYQTTLISEKN